MSRTGLGLAAVGAERRVSIWFAIYVIAVCSVVFFAAGLLPETVLLILISEVVFLTLRPRPGFNASTYRPAAPEQWQAPIAALRWAGLFSSAWAIVSTAVTITIGAVIAIVILVVIGFQTHHGLGLPNFAVLLLLATWLSTRPLWIGPLRKALKVEATKQLSPYLATLHVGTDGVEFDMRPAFVRRAPETYRFWVAFAELDEVRLMDGLTAQGYWGAMAQYDPTLGIRMEWELLHFMTNQRARPSIIGFLGFGTHLLVRGPTLMYLIGNADPFGPAAVAAWEAWRAARPAPAAPTA